MRKSILTGIVGLALLAGVASLMFTAAASARQTTATKVVVAMHDPGCHWFVSGPSNHRKWSLTRTVSGPVRLVNFDEATLIVKGPNATVRDKVGQTILLSAKGIY